MKAGRRRWVISAGIVLLLLGIGGLLVAASGIIPIKASSGHWAVTRAFLQFAKNRSIETHSLTTKVPDLTQHWQIVKGAGHYEIGCRPCHGAPDLRVPGIASAMLPNPPDLRRRVAMRDPAELFYIVKHGLKFTGMPAWPSLERDDEVWAVVAFLLQLPKLDDSSYRQLVYGDLDRTPSSPALEDLANDPIVPAIAQASCARCHGLDGLGRGNAAFPRLAGQKRQYLLLALRAYRDSARHSGIMEPIARSLSEDERIQLAGYYSSLTLAAPASSGSAGSEADEGSIARGESIARTGIPLKGVPSCMDCHGPGPHRRNAAYPDLAGQYGDYIVLQLELFASGRRGGSQFAHLMRYVASRLDAGEMRDVAAWYASVGSTTGSGER